VQVPQDVFGGFQGCSPSLAALTSDD